MTGDDLSALVLEEHDGKVSAGLQRLKTAQLPTGDVTVRVCRCGDGQAGATHSLNTA